MGDRAVIVVADKNGHSPGAYVHWSGSRVVELLKGAIPGMRCGDYSYSLARLVGHLHMEISGDNLGLGVYAGPVDLKPRTLEEYSPGDAGVLVYHCGTGRLNCYGGYLEDEYPNGLDLAVPPG
jgi:hypothetical protein